MRGITGPVLAERQHEHQITPFADPPDQRDHIVVERHLCHDLGLGCGKKGVTRVLPSLYGACHTQ